MQKKPDYFYNQSAVLPFRCSKGMVEILMITSRKKQRWVIPKGIKEPDLSPGASAAKEAMEEAGVAGMVSSVPVGTYEYQKWGGTCTVQVYTMEVKEVFGEWEESDRDREWVSVDEAISRVQEKQLKQIIRTLPEFLAA